MKIINYNIYEFGSRTTSVRYLLHSFKLHINAHENEKFKFLVLLKSTRKLSFKFNNSSSKTN